MSVCVGSPEGQGCRLGLAADNGTESVAEEKRSNSHRSFHAFEGETMHDGARDVLSVHLSSSVAASTAAFRRSQTKKQKKKEKNVDDWARKAPLMDTDADTDTVH